jgi:hypothetical protein
MFLINSIGQSAFIVVSNLNIKFKTNWRGSNVCPNDPSIHNGQSMIMKTCAMVRGQIWLRRWLIVKKKMESDKLCNIIFLERF